MSDISGTQPERLFAQIMLMGGRRVVTVTSPYLGSVDYPITEDGVVGKHPLHRHILLEHIEEAVATRGGVIVNQFLDDQIDLAGPNANPEPLPERRLYSVLCRGGAWKELSSQAIANAVRSSGAAAKPFSHLNLVQYCSWPHFRESEAPSPRHLDVDREF